MIGRWPPQLDELRLPLCETDGYLKMEVALAFGTRWGGAMGKLACLAVQGTVTGLPLKMG